MSEKGQENKTLGPSDRTNVANKTIETDQRKRTREDLSSISEHELSINSQTESNKQSQSKPKKKKSKPLQQSIENPDDSSENRNEIKTIMKQLENINKKLNNVLTKDDRYIHDVIEKTVEKKLSAQKIYAKDEDNPRAS